MKKIIICGLVGICAAAVAVAVLVTKPNTNTAQANIDYLRVHIRANSNDDVDQAVKYKVKERVVEFLTPYIASATSQTSAKAIVKNHLKEIEEVADEVLKENGFSYGARAAVRTEEFPTRSYGDTTLEAGVYEALILELGTGKGDNWWCVMFPPLCFVGSENNGQNAIRYRSKLVELIQKYTK